jgi:SAM-dependent methyltransferase
MPENAPALSRSVLVFPLPMPLPSALCPACGSALRDWARKNGHRLCRCVACATVVALHDDPGTPRSADYASYLEGAGFETPDHAAVTLDRLVVDAGAYRSSGCWLDVGFGEGALLRAAASRGWRCYGVEVSRQALAHGRDQGWTVAEPSVAEGSFPVGAFDVVSLVEVIEHLEEPIPVLQQAVAWLRPGGQLFVTTPNARSLNGRLLGSDWSIFCPPDHLTIWTPRGLRTVLKALGLVHIRVRTHGLNPAEIMTARRPPGQPIHRQDAADQLNRALQQTPVRRAAKRLANGMLSLAEVGDTLKAWSEKPR